MVDIGAMRAEGGPVGLSVWFDNGWLDQAQMAEVMHEIGVLPSVLVVDDDELPQLDATPAALEQALSESSDGALTGERPRSMYNSVAETLMPLPAPTPVNGRPGRADDGTTHPRIHVDDVGATQQHATLAWAKGGEVEGAAAGSRRLDEVTAVRGLSARDRYVIGKILGSGGGGRVVRAYDRVLGRTVAMKVLPADLGADAKIASRFMAEAQATGQLEHPNIVPIYDFGTLPSGELYYTMREVRRHSLRDALEGLRRGAPHYLAEYTLVSLVTVLRQVSQAVHYAHVRGVVHRDIKPDNIMVGDYGEVLVMDWGLARILERPARMNLAEQAGREEAGHTLGTPAYMPPEQARGELDEVDEQSDVYSLGAVLYEILTLEPPFAGDNPVQTMWEVVEGNLVPPRARAPDRQIPVELEKICLRAMAARKRERFATARDIAEVLEDWFEGLQPREAKRRVETGRLASQLNEELSVRIERLDEQVRTMAMQIEGWEALDHKRALWEVEDQREQARVERARAFGEAVSAFTQALAYQPENEEARRGLLQLYWKRLEEARAAGSVVDAIYFEALVRQYDDGRFARLLDSPAGLELSSDPPGADVRLLRLEEVDRRLSATEERALGTTPLEVAELEEGSYLLELETAERPAVRCPVRLSRGRSEVVAVALPDPALFDSGFVYIPGGMFTSGGDPEAFDPRPQRRVHVDPFFCGRFPVTFREYLEYINHLWRRDEDEALQRAPQTRAEEGLLVRFDEEQGAWLPDEILIEGPARAMYPTGRGHELELPVVGIRYEDALAFCRWRSERDGRDYRLPTQVELEKAGRGVDGRFFPWGNRFDPTFCKMRFSRPDLPQLEPVGAFEGDESPYGVRDVAGGVQEWCGGRDNALVDQPVKGGSWNQDQRAARVASRVQILAAARSAGIGMRLVYER